MKKLFAFILTFLYLGIATGFSTYSHYCMDRYVETSLWKRDMGKCGVCGMDKDKQVSKKTCCKEEHKQVKLDKKHQGSQYIYKEFHPFPVLVLSSCSILSLDNAWVNIAAANPFSHAPPNKEYKTIYILNCTYRI